MTDLLAVAIGGAVADLIIAVYLGVRRYRAHHRVPHRKLRATAEVRGKPAPGFHAPCTAPAAGPELRARLTARRGSAEALASMEPQPAPGPSSLFNPGAGLTARTAACAHNALPSGGPGHQQSAVASGSGLGATATRSVA
jgi:hypothetical protein